MNGDVYLLPMTADMYHAYFKAYQNDPDLYRDKASYTPYTYDEDQVNRYIQRQMDCSRRAFAILSGDEMVGELIIKRIIPHQSATLSISVKNASCKDRGFGTQAERLAIQYVFSELDIPVLYADSIVSNKRSQHVLEKVGFHCIGEDADFKYYCIERAT